MKTKKRRIQGSLRMAVELGAFLIAVNAAQHRRHRAVETVRRKKREPKPRVGIFRHLNAVKYARQPEEVTDLWKKKF
jgi:hypothetical protein